MTATTVAPAVSDRTETDHGLVVALDAIDLETNSRGLDAEHVDKLAASIALRGLVVPT